MANTTDPELIDAVKRFLRSEAQRLSITAEDHRDFEVFRKRYSRLIRKYFIQLGHRDDEIDDLEQNVWKQLLKQLPRFEREDGKGVFRSWLRKLVKGVAVDQWRREAGRHQSSTESGTGVISPIDPAPEPLDQLILDLQRAAAREALESMLTSERERTRYFGRLLQEFYWGRKSTEQLALEMNTSTEAIRKDRSRAYAEFLKHLLSGREWDDDVISEEPA